MLGSKIKSMAFQKFNPGIPLRPDYIRESERLQNVRTLWVWVKCTSDISASWRLSLSSSCSSFRLVFKGESCLKVTDWVWNVRRSNTMNRRSDQRKLFLIDCPKADPSSPKRKVLKASYHTCGAGLFLVFSLFCLGWTICSLNVKTDLCGDISSCSCGAAGCKASSVVCGSLH